MGEARQAVRQPDEAMDRVGAAIRMAKERRAGAVGREQPPTGLPAGTAWSQLVPFEPDPVTMARSRVVTFGRVDPACAFFDTLRTKLLRLMRRNGWRSVGITSPTDGCGKTTTSLNLAFSFAQLNLGIVLVDLDLRRPAVARQLGLSRSHSVAEVLQGTRQAADGFVRCGDNLAIGSSAVPIRNSADVLLSAATGHGVASLKRQLAPDILIYDLPPMLVSDDVLAFLPQLDCLLLVVGAETSRLDEVDHCMADLAETGASVRVVVNKCRYPEADFEYA